MNKLLVKLATCIAILTPCTAAHATPLTFEFSGHVSTILSDDSSNTFSANFAVNDTVQGTWSVDSTASANVLLPSVQYYDASFGVTISGHAFSGPAQYRHFNDHPTGDDGFSIVNEQGTYTGPSLGPLEPSTFFIQYLGMPAGTLSNFDLIADPGSLIPLATFVLHGLRLDSSTDDSFGALYFTIDSLHRAPEPGTIALIGIGFAGFAFARMRSIQTGRH